MSFNKIEYKTDVFTIRLIEPNILENAVISHCTLDVEHVWEVKKINTKLTKGEPYAFLAVKGEFSIVTKEAKDLLSSKEIIGNTVAKALLIQSLSDRIVANFYLKMSQPILKTKAFTNRDKAILWLKKQLHERAELDS